MIKLEARVTSSALLLNSKKSLRTTMRKAGAEVAAVAKGLMRNGGGGRSYRIGGNGRAEKKGGALYTASAPGNAPAVRTGVMRKSIRVRPFKSGEGVNIRAKEFYARFMETGAQGGGPARKFSNNHKRRKGSNRVMAKRPFLTAALAARSADLGKRIIAAVNADVQFVRKKP